MKRSRIVALWARYPSLTIEQVRRLTGAPSAVVRKVYRDLLAAKLLAKLPNRGREVDFLRSV